MARGRKLGSKYGKYKPRAKKGIVPKEAEEKKVEAEITA